MHLNTSLHVGKHFTARGTLGFHHRRRDQQNMRPNGPSGSVILLDLSDAHQIYTRISLITYIN